MRVSSNRTHGSPAVRRRIGVTVTGTLVALLVAVFGATQTTAAQGDGPGGGAFAEIAIAAFACPPGYVVPETDPITSAVGACETPAVGVDFSVRLRAGEAQPNVLTTGAGGDAGAGIAASDTGYGLQITLPTGSIGYIVNCTQADGDDAGTVYTAGGFQVQGAAETGDRIGCDVFFVFAGDGSGTSPVPSAVASSGSSAAPSTGTAPVASSAPVVGLPSTGTGTTAPLNAAWAVVAMLLAVVSLGAGMVARSRRR